jgi:peptidoglycan hydrolase CwlO-like protein
VNTKESTLFEDINYTGAKFWLDFLQVAFTALIGLYVWLSKPTKQNKIATEQLKDTLAAQDRRLGELLVAHDRRLGELELKLQFIPDQDEFHALDKKVSELVGKMDNVHGRMRSVDQKLDLLIENELRGKS